MNFETDCVPCGFACEKACPVSMLSDDYPLRDFLSRFLRDREPVNWPCMTCKACDAVCSAEYSPRELIVKARNAYHEAGHETIITDYYHEYIERGRLGISEVIIDDLEFPSKTCPALPLAGKWDRVIIFPGCLISAKYPWLVERLHELLAFLGIDVMKMDVDDEACCGSFLPQVDPRMFEEDGKTLVERWTRWSTVSDIPPPAVLREADKITRKVLVVTACGSCTATLKQHLEARRGRLEDETGVGAVGGSRIEVLHYLNLLSRRDVIDALKDFTENGYPGPIESKVLDSMEIGKADDSSPDGKHLEEEYLVTEAKSKEPSGGGETCVLQYPCQAADTPGRKKIETRALEELLGYLGFRVIRTGARGRSPVKAGCCGASLIETHGDLSISQGAKRLKELFPDPDARVLVGCGNCYRMFVDFRQSIYIENEELEGRVGTVSFLLDALASKLLGTR